MHQLVLVRLLFAAQALVAGTGGHILHHLRLSVDMKRGARLAGMRASVKHGRRAARYGTLLGCKVQDVGSR